MTKTELVAAIAAGVDGMSKAKAEQALNVTLSSIMDAVATGDTLTLVGFGSFSKGERAERTARNPRTGEEIKIPAGYGVKLSAGSTLKKAVSK